ncbi:MAG: hypothetical protein WCQ99_03900, partial [Pseudomonadota bacterium]
MHSMTPGEEVSAEQANTAPVVSDSPTNRETENMKKSGEASMKFQKPSQEELKKKLKPLQYQVTQEEGTEPPFNNE